MRDRKKQTLIKNKKKYLLFQIKGFLFKFYFILREYNLKKKCLEKNPFFIAILQVSSDSQITKGSKIKDNKKFIYKVLKDFVVRSQFSLGKVCKFTPGWDCHGLPIEHKVMQEIGWGKFLAECTIKWIEIETEKKIMFRRSLNYYQSNSQHLLITFHRMDLNYMLRVY